MSAVPAQLIGGPEDGLRLHIPGPEDAPMATFVITGRLGRDVELPDGELPPLLRYDRGSREPSGQWRYHFVAAEPVTLPDPL